MPVTVLYAGHFGKIHLIATVTILRVRDHQQRRAQKIPITLAETRQRLCGLLTMAACGNSYTLRRVESSTVLMPQFSFSSVGLQWPALRLLFFVQKLT